MLDLIILSIGGLGILGGLIWYKIDTYFKNRRMITYPTTQNSVDPIPEEHLYRQIENIPSQIDYSSFLNQRAVPNNGNNICNDVPPKYEDIDLYN